LQKSLALKMQKAAQEKSAQEKVTTQKGILSSVAEAILGEWWTGPDVHEKTMETLMEEQIKDLDNIIDKNLSEETKNTIKEAYQLFQVTLLNFSTKEYWDNEKSMPNALWIKKIKTPAFILIKHKIMSLENIISAL